MLWAGAVAVAKAHRGHLGRPGARGGSTPYGSEAQARDSARGIRYFKSHEAARAYLATQRLTGLVIARDPVRGHYVAPMRELPRLHRDGQITGSPRHAQPVPATEARTVAIKALADEQQIAYAEVYAPLDLDSQNEFMLPQDVEALAHGFLQHLVTSGSNSIDLQHDGRATKVEVVESFIARPDDAVFHPGAWVLGVHVPDRQLWKAMKAGDFSGFSFQALVMRDTVEIEVDDDGTLAGTTLPANGHTHAFTVTLDQVGRVVGGRTEPGTDGHVHGIRVSGRTEPADGHRHLYDLTRPIRVAA